MTIRYLTLAALVGALASAPALRAEALAPTSAAAVPAAAEPTALGTEYASHAKRVREASLPAGAVVGGFATIGLQLARPGQVLDPALLDPRAADALASWEGDGAFVIGVEPASAAEIAGLEPGDVVLGYAGLWVDGPETLERLVSRSRLGSDLEILALRGDDLRVSWVTPRDRCER